MPDRLEDLRRQRALVHEHLSWLDREIAALVPTPPPSHAPTPAPTAPALSRPALVRPEDIPDLSEYQVDPAATQADTRRGCLLYAAGALALFFVVLLAVYFLGYRDRPIFFADRPAHNNSVAPSAPTPK